MRSNYLNKIYLVLSLIAFIACWSQNIFYFQFGPFQGTTQFLMDAMANPAARSIFFDIAVFYLAAIFFMVTEGRRLKIPHTWTYIVLGFFVAISVTFPLWLMAREKRLVALEGTVDKA